MTWYPTTKISGFQTAIALKGWSAPVFNITALKCDIDAGNPFSRLSSEQKIDRSLPKQG